MGQVWKRTDWNDIIDRINGLADEGCVIAEPLEEVDEGHIWTVQDITDVRDKLTAICSNSPSFSVETVKWTQAIIDELNQAIDDCQCQGCPVAYIEMPPESREYTLTVFDTMSELWDNEHASLVYEVEGTEASTAAYDEWQNLQTLLDEDPSQGAVDAEVVSLNLAADLAWGYVSGANTDRHNWEPVSQWLDPSEIHTSDPAVAHFEFDGMTYRYWKWCQTIATVRVQYHGCWGDPPNELFTYADEYYFNGASSGSFFFAGRNFSYGDPNLFAWNESRACGGNFVGSGDCASVQRCVDYMNSQAEYSVTVNYETQEYWSMWVQE